MLKLARISQNIRSKMKFIDIGANLTDEMFRGKYGGKQKHPDDLDLVLERSWNCGMDKIIITVGTLTDSNEAKIISQKNDNIYMTMGCHPTRCNEFKSNPEEYFNKLCMEIENNRNKIVSIGEIGLDYDRLHFCAKETQKIYFTRQLELAEKYKLPLFLHCRNSHDDFIEIMNSNLDKIKNGGVVHSFDGSSEEANKLIELGFYIGINGCSLKTEENLQVVKNLPSNKIMIETDSPWCGVKNSHSGSKFVKTKFPTVKKKEKWTKDSLIDGRNEPSQIIQVLEIIAGCREEDIEKLSDQFYQNTMDLFFPRNTLSQGL